MASTLEEPKTSCGIVARMTPLTLFSLQRIARRTSLTIGPAVHVSLGSGSAQPACQIDCCRCHVGSLDLEFGGGQPPLASLLYE